VQIKLCLFFHNFFRKQGGLLMFKPRQLLLLLPVLLLGFFLSASQALAIPIEVDVTGRYTFEKAKTTGQASGQHPARIIFSGLTINMVYIDTVSTSDTLLGNSVEMGGYFNRVGTTGSTLAPPPASTRIYSGLTNYLTGTISSNLPLTLYPSLSYGSVPLGSVLLNNTISSNVLNILALNGVTSLTTWVGLVNFPTAMDSDHSDSATIKFQANVAVIPEPASLLLIGSGLAGLLAIKKKKK